MSLLIEDTFKKISDQKYVVVHRQIALAIICGPVFLVFSYFFLPEVVKSFIIVNFFYGLLALILYLILGAILLLFIAMGLMSTTTEIDFSSRKAIITKRNIRGVLARFEASLDNICISAVRMGGFDPGTLKGCWIVRAGFMFEGENGEEDSVAIWSTEVDNQNNIKERNEIMFELYRFFFPDRPPVTEANLITNGNVVMLLSDEEIEEFKHKVEEPEVFERKTTGASKFDNLV